MDSPTHHEDLENLSTVEPKITPEAEVDLNFGGEVEIEYVVTTGDIDEWRRVADPGVAERYAPPRAESKPEGRQRYVFRKTLGKGGMGEVRLCKDQMIGRSVAMKTMLPGYTKNSELLARFLREAQVQGQLEHPAIAPLYDLGSMPDGTLFFTMRRLRGRTLSAVLAGLRGSSRSMISLFSPSRLLQAFTTVCMAIDYAHSRGVLHRDLKPQNIMLGDYGEVYVLDWGIAKILNGPAVCSPQTLKEMSDDAVRAPNVQRLTGVNHVLGTMAYASPEQSLGYNELIDVRTDVFALGAILFEILTWQRLRPPQVPDRESLPEADTAPTYLSDPRPSVRAPQHSVPPELEAICIRATQPEPSDRYPSVRALLDELEAAVSGERATELRQQLAQGHAQVADAAANLALLGGVGAVTARETAIREAGRAVGIDSQSVLALGTLQRLIARPPEQLPPPVEQAMRRSLLLRERTRLRALAGAAMALFLLVLTLPLGQTVRDGTLMFLLGITAAGSAGLWLFLARKPRSARSMHYVGHGLNLALYALVGRLFGPLWLMTAPLAMNTFLQSATPDTRFRRFVVGSSGALLLGMVGLEALGWIEPSYLFESSGLTLHSSVLELTAGPSLIVLTIAAILAITVPALGVGELTTRLAKSERQLRLRAWHLAQVLPEDAQPISPSAIASGMADSPKG